MRWMRRTRPVSADPPASDRKIDFIAYATDCVVAGRVVLETERLAELLRGQDEYDLEAVSLEVLADDRVVELDTAKVFREDLCVVAGTGPRGNPARRVRTRPHPVRARVGPYDVLGYVHAMPTADVLGGVHRRPIIPVTLGSIRYLRGDEPIQRAHAAMLVNRDRIDWIEEAEEDHQVRFPDFPTTSPGRDPRARDLTGEAYAMSPGRKK